MSGLAPSGLDLAEQPGGLAAIVVGRLVAVAGAPGDPAFLVEGALQARLGRSRATVDVSVVRLRPAKITDLRRT